MRRTAIGPTKPPDQVPPGSPDGGGLRAGIRTDDGADAAAVTARSQGAGLSRTRRDGRVARSQGSETSM